MQNKTCTITIFFNFHKPPYGGGNQFLLALKKEFERRGLNVLVNKITKDTYMCIFNSYNFDAKDLKVQYSKYPQCKMIHRVDGPIGLYRGTDYEIDKKIFEYNEQFADITVFQSHWSLEETIRLGFNPKNPIVIHNAVDNDIFHTNGRIKFSLDRKIKLISTSWSDNPRKGAAIYKWIEEHLDWSRFEYTFVGRSQIKFNKIHTIKPQPSHHLAKILRNHDIYITASQKDPCSNALLEALACGLPAVYLDDGGHKELVKEGGLPFYSKDEILVQIEKIVENYNNFQKNISILSCELVAEKYLNLIES